MRLSVSNCTADSFFMALSLVCLVSFRLTVSLSDHTDGGGAEKTQGF